MSICVDCAIAPAVITVPAAHSFDAQGKPNGSKEMVCPACATNAFDALCATVPQAIVPVSENGGTY